MNGQQYCLCSRHVDFIICMYGHVGILYLLICCETSHQVLLQPFLISLRKIISAQEGDGQDM